MKLSPEAEPVPKAPDAPLSLFGVPDQGVVGVVT
jgi:hypothetical protein